MDTKKRRKSVENTALHLVTFEIPQFIQFLHLKSCKSPGLEKVLKALNGRRTSSLP